MQPALTAFEPPTTGFQQLMLLQRPGSRGLDLRRRVEVLKVLLEAVAQIVSSAIVGSLVGPRIARIQYLRRHAVTELRNRKSEGWLDGKVVANQLTFHRCIYHRSRVRDAHAPADAIAPALPACIDQPTLCIVLA